MRTAWKTVALVMLLLAVGTPALTAQEAKVVKVFTWLGDDAHRQMLADLQSFMQEHPGVQVELEIDASWFPMERLAVLAAVGDTPDVILMNSVQFQQVAANGIIQPLDPFIEKDGAFTRDHIVPGLLDTGEFWGMTYLLPYAAGPIMVYYNQDAFEAAGLAYPSQEWTLEGEFLEAARRLTGAIEDENRRFGYLIGRSHPIMAAYGLKGYFPENAAEEAAFVEAHNRGLRFLRNLIWEYGVAATGEMIGEGVWDAFVKGRGAMYHDGPWYQANLALADFRWDMAPNPVGVEAKTMAYTNGFGLSATTRHPDEAWEVLKFVARRTAWYRDEIPSFRSEIEHYFEATPKANPDTILRSIAMSTVLDYRFDAYLGGMYWPLFEQVLKDEMDPSLATVQVVEFVRGQLATGGIPSGNQAP